MRDMVIDSDANTFVSVVYVNVPVSPAAGQSKLEVPLI